MKSIPPKDLLLVSIQVILFIGYFFPVADISFQFYPIVRWACLLIAALGAWVIGFAMLQLNTNLTPFPTPRASGSLIHSGLYRYVRHPIYSGIIMASIGFGIYNGSLWQASTGLALWLLFHMKSIYEERLLASRFPGYEDYQKSTARFFPFV